MFICEILILFCGGSEWSPRQKTTRRLAIVRTTHTLCHRHLRGIPVVYDLTTSCTGLTPVSVFFASRYCVQCARQIAHPLFSEQFLVISDGSHEGRFTLTRTIRANNLRKRLRSTFGLSIHTHANVNVRANCSRECSRKLFARTVCVVCSIKCKSCEKLANQADFRRIFYLLIPAGRKLYLKSMQYAALNNVLCWIFAISLCIPSQIDARRPAIF